MASLPRFEPMLATPLAAPPTDDGWAYEIKWDGIRALAYVTDGALKLSARRGSDHTPKYPELATFPDALGGREAILDGEIVAFDDEGRPRFQLLQRRMGLANETTIRRRSVETPATFVAFDVLWLAGESLIELPYEKRRERLDALEMDGRHWRAPRNHVGDGAALWDLVRERDLEGIVAKRLGSPYRPGKRSREWAKVRNRRGQELVIGGWMPGEGSRGGRVGSLLVGHYVDGKLAYAGGVGTGFTQDTLDELTSLLEPLKRSDSPFELGEDPVVKYAQRARDRGAGPIWVEPELVAEVEFSEWTNEGTLRQSAFKGLRTDKDAREVVRET